MNHSIVLDPTAERAPVQRARLARPASLEGKVVGLLDISKPRGNVFLDRIEEQRSGVPEAERLRRATHIGGQGSDGIRLVQGDGFIHVDAQVGDGDGVACLLGEPGIREQGKRRRVGRRGAG